MGLPNRFGYVTRSLRYVVVAVAAFALGSATIASASTGGFPVGSLFFISQINGVATTPCNSSRTAIGQTTTCNAVVDSTGQLATSDAATQAALAKNQYDTAGNLRVTGQGTSTVSGSVSVNNLPAVQAVSGAVGVNNFPASQTVNGTVHVDNMPSSGGSQVATRGIFLDPSVKPTTRASFGIHMTVTYMRVQGCTIQDFFLTGGGDLFFGGAENLSFPSGISIDYVQVTNNDTSGSCAIADQLFGY